MKEPDKFTRERLGDTYKDRRGEKWQFKSYCPTPTVVLVNLATKQEITTSVDSLWAAEMTWFRRVEANG